MQSVTFADAKRTFTKDVLMRIDLLELANIIDDNYIETELQTTLLVFRTTRTISTLTQLLEPASPLRSNTTGQFFF